MNKLALRTFAFIASTAILAAPAKADLSAFGIGGSMFSSPSVNEAFGIQADPNFNRAAQVCRNNGYAQVRTHGQGRYQCFTGINNSGVWTF